MRKFLTLSIMAAALTCVSHQQASAWHNLHLKIGMDWSWQSGNNKWLWGLMSSGEPMAPLPSHHMTPVYPQYYGPQPVVQYALPHHTPATQNQGRSGAPNDQPASTVRQAWYSTSYYYGYGVQPVNYYYSGYGYAAPSYYYYSAPSYWYGY